MVRLTRGLLWIGLLIGCHSGIAQKQPADSSFIQLFPDTLNLRVLWVSKGFDLRASHAQQPGTLLYLPRYRPRIGFGGFLWNIGFNFLLPLGLPKTPEESDFRRFDFQGSLFARRWLIDGAFHRYRGFVLRTTGEPQTTPPDELLEQLVTKKIQASITYLPGGDRVSLRSSYNQGDRQQATSGSLLLSGTGSYFTVREPTDVVGGLLAEPDDVPLSQVRVYALSSKLGYVTNLTYRSWFLHLFAMTGLDWQQTYYQQQGDQNAFSVEPTWDVRGGLGYDSGHFYGGVYGTLDYHQFDAGEWQFQATSGQLRLFFGIRFAEPAWLHRRKPKILEDLQNSPSIPLPPIFG